MSTHPDQVSPRLSRLSRAARASLVSLKAFHSGTYQVLHWMMVLALVAYFAFGAAFLGLRYLVLPNIEVYKPDVARIAGTMLNRPVSIGGIAASWSGLNPKLRLDQVVIHDDQGDRVLVLPEVSATLSWWSVLGQLRLHALEVRQPDLEIERDAQGRLFVAGIRIDTDKPDDGRGLDWLLAQREIVIRDGRVRWRDQLRQAPELALTDISFVLRNQWRSHRAALRATPPAALAAPIDLRADFTHPPFSQRSSDYSQWSGELYADWRNTQVDGWKPYLDLPGDLASGEGAVRAWLSFSRGVVQNFTADLDLRDVSARLGDDLPPLRVLQVSGRISAGEEAPDLKQRLFSFGELGHLLTLSNFSLQTDQGTVLPRTTASHRYMAARQGKPEQHELKITALDLDALARLATHLPLSKEERQMLDDFAPRGELKDFTARWDGALPGAGNYKLSGQFRRLALRQQLPATTGAQQAAIPGFDGLSGEINADQDGGRLRVNGERATLYLANLLINPTLFFEQLSLDGSWSFRNGRRQLAIRVADLRFRHNGLAGRVEGTHLLPLPLTADNGGQIDIDARFPSVELARVVGFLPSAVGRDAQDWMRTGILDGVAHDVHLVARGQVDRLPFSPSEGANGKDGIFRVSARLANAKLSPAPAELAADRRTPLWPRIENINGRLTIDGNRLHIHADGAKTLGVPLSAVDAVIPDFMADNPVLEINGSAGGTLQGMLGYVNATPVGSWLDGLTEEARASGNARLGLKLQIPLMASAQTTVQGSLRFAGNELQLWRTLPVMQQVGGEIGFSERGFQLNGVSGSLLGGPVALAGGTQRDGSTLVRLDGTATADGIARFASGSDARRIVKRLTGATRYSTVVKVRNQRPEITFDSALSGLAIDLPAPLGKPAAETMPLRVTAGPVGLFEQSQQSEEIRVSLGRALSARYLRQRPATRNQPWRVVRGGIGINVAPPLTDNGVAVSVSLPTLNLDAWRAVLAAPTGIGADTGSDAAPSAAAAFVTPDSISLRSNAVSFAERTFDNVTVTGTRQRSGWQFNLNADEMAGRATWEDPLSERGAGKLTARLSHLKIERGSESNMTALLSGKKAYTELPGLDIIAEDFDLRGLKLGRLELAATNAGLAAGAGREWQISKLVVSNPGATMRATGRWVTTLTENQTSLSYGLDIGDAGALLDRLGFERALRGGKGQMDGELGWKGDPTAFDFPTLSGSLTLKLAQGQFLKADPGVAKLLGVMSLQALPRRLTLDFRDIFSEGFAFDSVASSASIVRGTLKTDSFKMSGPNGVVLMDGTVDLAAETQNLNVVVIPELNTAGASVMYGLAVNPVIGLGTFLAQLFLKNPLSQALALEYQVTGPWRDPVVRKQSRRKVVAEQDKASP